MFTFLDMLAMVVSESSFAAYVCPRRPAGLHRDKRLLLNLSKTLDFFAHSAYLDWLRILCSQCSINRTLAKKLTPDTSSIGLSFLHPFCSFADNLAARTRVWVLHQQDPLFLVSLSCHGMADAQCVLDGQQWLGIWESCSTPSSLVFR